MFLYKTNTAGYIKKKNITSNTLAFFAQVVGAVTLGNIVGLISW